MGHLGMWKGGNTQARTRVSSEKTREAKGRLGRGGCCFKPEDEMKSFLAPENQLLPPQSIPQPCPTHGGKSDRGSHFPDGDTEAPRGGQKFPHQPFFKDENPISGFQGFGKGNPGDKGLGLIASLSLFTLCTGGAASAGPPGPQSPSLPQRAWGLSQGQDWGWRAELHSPPAPT